MALVKYQSENAKHFHLQKVQQSALLNVIYEITTWEHVNK